MKLSGLAYLLVSGAPMTEPLTIHHGSIEEEEFRRKRFRRPGGIAPVRREVFSCA